MLRRIHLLSSVIFCGLFIFQSGDVLSKGKSEIFGDNPGNGKLKFKAEGMSTKLALPWSTSSQHNTDYFIVERSTDGLNWKEISKEKADEDCSVPLYYEAFDEKAPTDLCFYRIKTLFLDHTEEISSMTAVDRSHKKEYLAIFPQVAYDHFCIISSERLDNISYEVKDRKVRWVELQVTEVHENKIVFDIRSLPKADYSIRLRSASGMGVKEKLYVKWGQ